MKKPRPSPVAFSVEIDSIVSTWWQPLADPDLP